MKQECTPRRRWLPAWMACALGLLVWSATTASALAQEARVIVKYRAEAGAPGTGRAQRLAARLGMTLRSGRRIHDHAQVVHADGIDAEALAARLARAPEVEYAVPDGLRGIRSLPNDPEFTNQWYLQSSEAAAINATGAWDKTTGAASVIVAVLDTGVRLDHPDLAGKLLPGYNFISDMANAGYIARGPDPSDPGDYVTSDMANTDAALRTACGTSLTVQNSSWHGTRVAGIIGAASNNALGIAGTSFGSMLLPVRVLGKCGGHDSDIIAGMRWAAGLPVPGVPDNPNPAKILNLSLGGSGSCSAAYTDAITELTAHGVLVVAAAGNGQGAVEVPGNCPGVLTVAGVRHIGSKVGYSSMGPEVSISAPAGNCVNTTAGSPCLYGIETTTNLGTTDPGANGYTSPANPNVGTSFSAPQVSGVAALMLAVNPGLAPADIISRVKQTARPFPFDSSLSGYACPTVATGSTNYGQCNCTTATCGAGLLDAAAAVAASLPPTANLVAGWNLIGNATTGSINVASAFGVSAVSTVWKWVAGAPGAWAFYSPGLSDGGVAYAASKGYVPLTTIASGEGFWVNALSPFSAYVGSGNLRASSAFQDGTGPGGANPLVAGWNLIAVGDNPTPRAFVNAIAASAPASGAATSVQSLWAWNSGSNSGWYFYAPQLDNSGSLAAYIVGKGYLDFGTMGKTLDPATGFWVNHP